MTLVFVALGGMIGALLRYGAFSLPMMSSSNFEFLKVFLINCLGSAIFGFLWAFMNAKMPESTPMRLFVFSGILGSFTTFSAFSFDSVSLLLEQRFFEAGCNILGQVIFSLALLVLFLRLGNFIFNAE